MGSLPAGGVWSLADVSCRLWCGASFIVRIMLLVFLHYSRFPCGLPLACSYAFVYFSPYELFERHWWFPQLVSCDCEWPRWGAERMIIALDRASVARGTIWRVFVWRPDDEVAALAVAFYVVDLIPTCAIHLGVIPSA